MKKILTLLVLLTCFFSKGHAYLYDLTATMVFQNEAPYLKEWIEYHHLLGVQHFYLYNHHSQDNYLDVLRPYIANGIVELEEARDLPDFNGTQMDCYNRTLQKTYGVSKWVAFIDSDEFITSPNFVPIPSILRFYENYAGLALNWHTYGTSHVEKIPSNCLLLECLTKCSSFDFSMNCHIKTIARPECCHYFTNPHHPVYVYGLFGVDTDLNPVYGPYNFSIKSNILRINHYWTRDNWYMEHVKIPRRTSWGNTAEEIRTINQSLNQVECDVMLPWIPILKKRLGME